MRGWAPLLLACLVSAGLAGCTGESSAKTDSDDTGPLPPPIDVDEDSPLGAISCVVVDETIRPIANATVSLGGVTETSQSASDGSCAFEDLEPGTYFIHASAAGFFDAQQGVEVESGEVTTARIMLQLDPALRPFANTHKFEGFIEASASIATFAGDLVLELILGESPLCRCAYPFTAGSDTEAFVFEAVWTPNVANPAGTDDLYYEFYPTNDVTLESIKSAFLESPILIHFDRNATWGGDDGEFMARLTGASFWVDFQQDYQMFITEWHRGQPPTGWSYVNGDPQP
jgi:hypothetical protein